MCGFVGVFEIGRNGENLRAQVLRMSGKIRHRGPDWSGIYCGPRAVLSHERLSIVDPQSGGQPLYSPDGRLVLAVNGEIYNHRELRRELAGEYDKIYDPATGEYGVDVVEIPGSAILASALKEDSTVENLGEIAGETYGNLSYLSVADWMPADLLHK